MRCRQSVVLTLETASRHRHRPTCFTPSTSGSWSLGRDRRVRLTHAAYAHGLALALPEKVEMARPTGVGRAIATYTIPIEGRDEWLAAARRLA